jgi:hypothetical protein
MKTIELFFSLKLPPVAVEVTRLKLAWAKAVRSEVSLLA